MTLGTISTSVLSSCVFHDEILSKCHHKWFIMTCTAVMLPFLHQLQVSYSLAHIIDRRNFPRQKKRLDMTGMPTWVYSPYHRIVVHTIRICVCIYTDKYNYPVVDCQWPCWGSQFYMDPWSCVSSLCHLLYKLDVRPANVCIFNWFLGWVRSTSHQGTTTAMRLDYPRSEGY